MWRCSIQHGHIVWAVLFVNYELQTCGRCESLGLYPTNLLLYTERRFVTYIFLTKCSDKYQQLNSFCNKLQIFPEDGGKYLLRTSAYTRLNCGLLLRLLYFQCLGMTCPSMSHPHPWSKFRIPSTAWRRALSTPLARESKSPDVVHQPYVKIKIVNTSQALDSQGWTLPGLSEWKFRKINIYSRFSVPIFVCPCVLSTAPSLTIQGVLKSGHMRTFAKYHIIKV